MKNYSKLWALMAAFVLSTVPLISNAQNTTFKGSVSGHVQNQKGEPMMYVSVLLRKAVDSTFVKAAYSDTLGNLKLKQLSKGPYFIQIERMGAVDAHTVPFRLDKTHKTITLPPITLEMNAQNLEGVTVSTSKPLIEHRAGHTVVNVKNSSLSAGNSIMEVLRKSPGVLVDQNDNISLNGKKGVMVMINGRPTHLAAKQLANYLKSAPAASVSKIELMTQPPAKYSAEGTAGIINIVLDKKTATGMNGSLTAGVGYGQYGKYNFGGSLNYRGKKLNVYGSYYFNHQKNEFTMEMDRKFFTPETDELSSLMHQNSRIGTISNTHTAQLGMDYSIAPKQNIGFVLNGSFNNGDFDSHSPVEFLNANRRIDSISTSENHIGYNWDNESANLHYNIGLDDKGSALTANADYSHFHQDMPQSIKSETTDAAGNNPRNFLFRKGEQPTEINIYAAKLDYTQALKNQMKLSAGVKTSFVHTDNNSVFRVRENGTWEDDPGNTNHFVYKENVNAAYLSLDKKFKKGWSAKLGIRAEQVNIKTDQMTTDSVNRQDYIDFFPSVSLTKVVNPNNILSLSYTRRIDRPNYQSLNPFVYYVDKYTFRTGNPYLNPQYINKLAFSYTYKRRYSAELSYSHTNDIISRVVRQDDNSRILFQTKDNISKLDNVNLLLSVPVRIANWWNSYNSATLMYKRYDGLYNGIPLQKDFVSFMANTYQIFTIGDGWKTSLSGMYRSGMIMGPLIVDPMGLVSVGLQKSLWDDKATIKLNVQDVFQSLNVTGKMDFGNLHLHNTVDLNRRAVNLSFTWNFGNQKIKVRKHRDTGIKKEENRIQKGSGKGGV